MQKQLALCDPELKGVRSVYIYPQLSFATLAKVTCVNKQLSQEMREMCLKSNCDKLTNAIVDAWHCFGEDGCHPKIKICTWDILCFSNKKMQDTFAIGCVESIIKPGIWREERCLIGKDDAAWSLSGADNNQIIFQPTNNEPQNICIDYEGYRKKATDYSLMSIYSIDREIGLNQDEFNAVVNKNIETPLIVLIDSSVLKNTKNMQFLLKKFKMLKAENQDLVDTCLTDLESIDQLYSMAKNVEIDAIIAHWQNPDDYTLRIENRSKYEKDDKKDQAQIKKDKRIKKLQQMTMRLELQRIDEEQAKLAKKNNEENK